MCWSLPKAKPSCGLRIGATIQPPHDRTGNDAGHAGLSRSRTSPRRQFGGYPRGHLQLGATLFWCLIGKTPFPSCGNAIRDLIGRLSQAPPSLGSIRSDVPSELDAVVGRMMAVNPEQRYHTPQAAMNALLPFVATDAVNRSNCQRCRSTVPSADHPQRTTEIVRHASHLDRR